ncbi:ImmA/IrrE family metallo-endopeptidase [Bacillus haynesii]|uniref:ImmA/IrrE family metallo-endopeptidase n=1 Tax=Bacillus haynesii TaxID=1925021 RepID=UPI002D06A9C0|nr:ImmA/IrrE family metallo-endopeptidase [Candidatus Nitrosocosmicus sp.]
MQQIGLKVEFMKMTSRYYNAVIILDSRLSPPEQWQEFGHELCHALETKLTMSPLSAELQEMQANVFAYKFCVPSFMLKRIQLSQVQIDLVRLIASRFKYTRICFREVGFTQ